MGAGVIDPDYRGTISILLFNFSDIDFKGMFIYLKMNYIINTFLVAIGDRIAQIICEKAIVPEVKECFELDQSERGSLGFGSSGLI